MRRVAKVKQNRKSAEIIKRVIDILGAAFAILVLSPFLIGIFVFVKLDTKGPAVFVQKRVGKDGKIFKVFKFRTMKVGAELETSGKYICESDSNLTKTGIFLRRWALDELPQFLNVLIGDMSLVGPRPTLPYQVNKYDEIQKKRLFMKPGLTGWAQINGRNSLNWPARIELDVWYVENWSLWLDIKILLRTPRTLLRKDWAFAEDESVTNSVVRMGSRD